MPDRPLGPIPELAGSEFDAQKRPSNSCDNGVAGPTEARERAAPLWMLGVIVAARALEGLCPTAFLQKRTIMST